MKTAPRQSKHPLHRLFRGASLAMALNLACSLPSAAHGLITSAKTLRLWRFKDGKLTEIATKTGLTNHKIGWDFIAGGLRNCADTPEMITADANWSRIIATAYDGTYLSARDIGPYAGPQSLTKALSCP